VNCETVFALLSADVDGEVAPDEATAVRAHLASCPACVRRRRLLEETRRAFRAVAPAAVPTAFDDAVLERVRGRQRRDSWRLPVAVAAAAAGLALVLLRPNVPHGRDSRPTPPTSTAGRTDATSVFDAGVEIDCTVAGPKLCRPAVPCGEGECAPPSTTTLVLAGSRLASNIY
jgi:anti-sigma factor RsiW